MACSDSAPKGWLATLDTMLSACERTAAAIATDAPCAAWPAFWMDERFFWDNDITLLLLKLTRKLGNIDFISIKFIAVDLGAMQIHMDDS
jgi:hypothetical protein